MVWDRKTPLRLLWFYLGLSVMMGGLAMVIKPGFGAAPWDIFHLGFAGKTGLSLGLVVELAGLAVVLVDLTLGIKPTFGMILNMLSCGPIMQWELNALPNVESLALKWAMLLVGIFLTGFGTALYVSADLGTGPRDGLMIGLTRRLGVSVGVVKNTMDLSVAALGWWLGGPLGLGTVVVALGQGPAVQLGFGLVARLAAWKPLSGWVRPVELKSR